GRRLGELPGGLSRESCGQPRQRGRDLLREESRESRCRRAGQEGEGGGEPRGGRQGRCGEGGAGGDAGGEGRGRRGGGGGPGAQRERAGVVAAPRHRHSELPAVQAVARLQAGARPLLEGGQRRPRRSRARRPA
ncbi:unnamed protein product, partial [Prorocentrum cordatum]